MHGEIVRRIQPFALIRIGNHRDGAVVLITHDAARAMLARKLPALEIERVAVAVVRRVAEHGHAPVVVEVAQLPV